MTYTYVLIRVNLCSAAPYIKRHQKASQTNINNSKIFRPAQEKSSIKFSIPVFKREKMKLFFVLAVATSSLLLLVQGAPSPGIRSEELGKAMEQLKEMIKSEIQTAKSEWYPQAKSEWGPRAKSEWGPRAKSEQYPWARQQNYDRLVSL